MALVPLPQQDQIIDPAWGQLVATKLNAGASLGAIGNVGLVSPNQVQTVGIPGAAGPCLVVVQGAIRIDNGGQYVGAMLVVNGGGKAFTYANGQGAGGHWFPFCLMCPVPEAATVVAEFTLGGQPIAAQVTDITAVVVPLSGTAAVPATVATTNPADAGEITDD